MFRWEFHDSKSERTIKTIKKFYRKNILKRMNIHEFIALSRSGHHAMMNWVIQNLVGFQNEWKYKITSLSDTKTIYINEGNFDTDFTFKYLNENKNDIKNILIGYEDVDSRYTIFNDPKKYFGRFSKIYLSEYGANITKRIIFIRDFYNNLSSRIRANNNKGMFVKVSGEAHIFDVGHEFIKNWKSLAKSIVYNGSPYLKFEDWLQSRDIRNNFIQENFNTIDLFGIENINGTSSSFGESKNYNKRFDPDLIPEEIKEIVRKDNELHYLIGRLGYEFKEI